MVSLNDLTQNSPPPVLSDEWMDLIFSTEPSTLLYGAGGSGKIFTQPDATAHVTGTPKH